MARVLLGRAPYVISELGHEDLPQLSDPSMEGLSAANISYIHISDITSRAKRVREIRYAHPVFLNSILSKVIVASHLLIEADGEWAEVKAAENPNALVEKIHRTKFTHVDGVTSPLQKLIFLRCLRS